MSIYSRQVRFTEDVITSEETYSRLVAAEGTMSTRKLTALALELGVERPDDEPGWNVAMLFPPGGGEKLVWRRVEETPLSDEEIAAYLREHPERADD